MGMPRDPDARRFYRVALKRFEDGKLMLERLQRTTAAIYLAGYATECILKALLLSALPKSDRQDLLDAFVGRRGHNLEWFRQRLKDQQIAMDDAVRSDFIFITGEWSTSLRYDPTEADVRTAERFLNATQTVMLWAQERI